MFNSNQDWEAVKQAGFVYDGLALNDAHRFYGSVLFKDAAEAEQARYKLFQYPDRGTLLVNPLRVQHGMYGAFIDVALAARTMEQGVAFLGTEIGVLRKALATMPEQEDTIVPSLVERQQRLFMASVRADPSKTTACVASVYDLSPVDVQASYRTWFQSVTDGQGAVVTYNLADSEMQRILKKDSALRGALANWLNGIAEAAYLSIAREKVIVQ